MTLDDALKKMWDDWIATRPANVQRFAADNPGLYPGATVKVSGAALHFIGFGEYPDDGVQPSVGLILSTVDPFSDYEGAQANRVDVCPGCSFEVLQ